jgi:hypothetical protein
MFLFSAFFLLISTYAIPNIDTTNNQIDKMEMPTTFQQIFEHTSVDELVQNKTESMLNVSNVPIATTTITSIPNSTASNTVGTGRGIIDRLIYYNTTFITYTTTTPFSSGLSSGATAGIIVGAIILLCCCAICGGAAKTGHWETVRVWVEH